MSDMRYWAGAGLLTAGLSAAVLAGAGVSVADDGTEPGADASSSASSKPSENKADSKTEPKPNSDEPDKTEPRKDEEQKAEPDVGAPVAEADGIADEKDGEKRDGKAAPQPRAPKVSFQGDGAPTVRTESEPTAREPAAVGPAAQPQLSTAAAASRREIEIDSATTSLAQPAAAVTTAQAAPAGPSLLNVIGTIAWSVLDTVTKLVDVPPTMPPASPVSFGRSTLLIDCGPGYTADTDWYYPSSGEADRFIYFQHGFAARAGFYDVTLRELAERNNAIVVAPSITSNYFDCNGCSLTGESMEAAVARLFEGDRAALTASAQAAGYDGALPQRFVLMGQSAGAITAAGASGFYYDRAPAGELPNLVGVILYDVSASGGALQHSLDSLPASVPVLNIASPPQLLNTGGNAGAVFAATRSGRFNGVQLVNGAHSDGFRSSGYGGLIQAIVSVGFGASAPENVEAVQLLTKGWIADMYAGRVYDAATRTGIYGSPGAPGQVLVDIPTSAGTARAYVLPAPPPNLSPVEQFIAEFLNSLNGNRWATCQNSTVTAVPSADPTLNRTGRPVCTI